MHGLTKNAFGGAGLNQAASIHDAYIIRDTRDDAKVMGDQDHRHIHLLGQIDQQAKDLGLNRHVQRRCRFIRDDQFRFAHQGHGDDDALAQPAGQLMRVLAKTAGCGRDANLFQYNIVLDTVEIETDRPFATSSELTLEMLMDTLGKEVHKIEYKLVAGLPHTKLKGVETDSLFKQMMTISDNFLAEQLLVLASDKLFDSLNIGKVIEYAEKNYLSDLPDKPVWVDGSGLSSHNKFTPRSIIALLKKIREEIPEEKIYAFFPAGGKSGTIKSWYASGNAKPYIYAKTGTLDGTHCLSGYLLTKSNNNAINFISIYSRV